MIKFFRHIRQSLLMENKTAKPARTTQSGRYFKYAIGEIVLVVIGILIALQINNWNTQRQVRQLEVKYLNEIAKNLKPDLQDIRFNIQFNTDRLLASEMVLKCLDEHTVYSDTMDVYFGGLLYTTRSVVNYSAYETLRSRGLEIVSNDSLRQMITKLYAFQYHNVIDFEIQDDHALQYNVVMPAVMEHVAMRPIPEVGKQLGRPMDFEALKDDAEFKNALIMNADLRMYMLSNYRNLEKHVIACQDAIRTELERLQP